MSKTVFVTIAGRTNAGKSSLLNALIGEKIASVSSKSQTTRTKITGIVNSGETQIVLMDTPGLHKPKNKLSNHMLNTISESITNIDVVLFMMDCTRNIGDQERTLLDNCFSSKTNVILVLNKIDLITDKSMIAFKIAQFSGEYPFTAVIPISVKQNDGINLVIDEVKKLAVEAPHYFPDDMLTDQPEKVIASEIIREKFLNLLQDEVPHGIAVGVENMKERRTSKGEIILDISAMIYCERESHKGIIIGKNGSMLKKASTYARKELESFFQIRVNLQCWVKVKEDWRNREGIIKNFGLSQQ